MEKFSKTMNEHKVNTGRKSKEKSNEGRIPGEEMPDDGKDSLANPKSSLINYFLINSFLHI